MYRQCDESSDYLVQPSICSPCKGGMWFPSEQEGSAPSLAQHSRHNVHRAAELIHM